MRDFKVFGTHLVWAGVVLLGLFVRGMGLQGV